MEDEEKKYNYGKRPLWQWLVLYAVIAVVAYGLVYYFVLAKNGGANFLGYNSSSPSYASPTQTMTSPTPQNSNPSSNAQMQKITVLGTDYAFSPSAIVLVKGEPAEITFKNNGAYPHNLSIPDLNVKTKTIQPGQTDTIAFTPTKTGSFGFLCTVPGHADRGMTGTLTVQ